MVGRGAISVAQLALVGRCMIRSISPSGITSYFWSGSPSDEASHSLDPILDNEWGVGQSVNLLSQLIEPTSIFHELCCCGQCCELPQARVLQKHNAVVQNNQDICFFCLESYYLDLLRLVISCWLKALIACRPTEEILERDSVAYDILYVLIHTHGEMNSLLFNTFSWCGK